MEKEWYIEQYEDMPYLHSKELMVRVFPWIEGEHNHCEICWNRFSMYPGDQHIGYYQKESKCWICNNSYERFAFLFHWKIKRIVSLLWLLKCRIATSYYNGNGHSCSF